MTGYGVAIVCSTVVEVSKSVVTNPWGEALAEHFPKTEAQFKDKLEEMDVQWQFSCAFAAVDGCHLPIKCPSGGADAAKEYHNLKIFYLVVLMGLIDAKQRIIWSSVGFPGNSHDSTILQSTNLYHKIIANGIIPPMAKNVQDTNIFLLILGDGAFPFKTWLMKPFSHAILKRKEKYFNYHLSRA